MRGSMANTAYRREIPRRCIHNLLAKREMLTHLYCLSCCRIQSCVSALNCHWMRTAKFQNARRGIFAVSPRRARNIMERRKRSFYISLDSLAKKICVLSRANFLKIIWSSALISDRSGQTIKISHLDARANHTDAFTPALTRATRITLDLWILKINQQRQKNISVRCYI